MPNPIARILQPLLRSFGTHASRRIGGHKFHFDASTDIGRSLLFTGQFEKHALDQCTRYIKNDSVVIDDGANINVHTVHFARCAPCGRVISIEPARGTLQYLLRNIAPLVNVVPLNVALSDVAGIQKFFVATDNAHSGLKDTKRRRILREDITSFRLRSEIDGSDDLPRTPAEIHDLIFMIRLMAGSRTTRARKARSAQQPNVRRASARRNE